jgi:hypothetical protein
MFRACTRHSVDISVVVIPGCLPFSAMQRIPLTSMVLRCIPVSRQQKGRVLSQFECEHSEYQWVMSQTETAPHLLAHRVSGEVRERKRREDVKNVHVEAIQPANCRGTRHRRRQGTEGACSTANTAVLPIWERVYALWRISVLVWVAA